MTSVLENRHVLWIVSALAALLFVATRLPWHLDDYDQAKQAFTSYEMVEEGHWLYQRTPQERVATKPPFVGWISAGIFEATRSWELGWHLPSLVAAGVLSLLLFRASKIAFGLAAGVIAVGAFAFNLLSPRLAGLVRTDMLLALVAFVLGLQIWGHIREGAEWTTRDRWWVFVVLTTGVLIKGPILYAFLLPGLIFFQWWRRRSGTPSAWCGWWPWLASLSIFLLWTLGGSLFVPRFFDQIVVHEFMGRFSETVHRPQPLYFYWPHLLHKFAPWSALMIALAVVDLRASNWKWREIKVSPETFWLICWTFGGLIVMSLIPSKRVDRVYPVIPPLCLLLATQISARPVAILRWVTAALMLSILSAFGYSGFKVVTAYREHHRALVDFGSAVRAETGTHNWRYEVLESSDEGLLLYLRKLHFVREERAVAEWNSGNLDALVALTEDAPRLLRQLSQATLSSVRSQQTRPERRNYVLITR